LLLLAPAISALTINTPTNVVMCQPYKFTWSGGESPYYLSLIPAQQVTAPPLKVFPTQTGTEYSWLVDLQAGTAFTAALKDNTGTTAYSSDAQIIAGSSTSCLNVNVTETAGSATGPSTPSQTANGTSSGTSGAPSSSSTSKSAGFQITPEMFGSAAIFGALSAALF